jgi:hypothetical protein
MRNEVEKRRERLGMKSGLRSTVNPKPSSSIHQNARWVEKNVVNGKG